jgi:acyl-CoA synthetase (AMP-forming)/AMP-acid ligase II
MENERSLQDNLIRRVNVGDLLLRSAERFPGKEMVCDGERRWTYRAFNEWTNRIANGLSARGLRQGDSLALMSQNRAEFLATYFACAKLGVVCVPINLLWRQRELAYVVEHSKARTLVIEADLVDRLSGDVALAPMLRDAVVIDLENNNGVSGWPSRIERLSFVELADGQSSVEPRFIVDDRAPLTCLYTSGTTSAPKGVIGSHLAIYLNSLGTALDTRMTESDRISVMLPLFHTAQLNALCTPAIAVGASMVILQGFDAALLHETIERERISVLFALPMMVRALVERQLAAPRALDDLRLAIYAMASMPEAELRRAIEVLGCDLCLLFGQTEMSPVATFFRPEHQLRCPGSVGTPAINVQVGIMDEHGTVLPRGSSGEIVYRSPQALSGYLDNAAATEQVFRHGWFHSGDAGHVDADGFLWFEDRFKDVIKSGGENVSSLEIEQAVCAADPHIQEAAAIGLPHHRWGEAITAVVVPVPGATIDESALLSAVRGRLSPFKCPKAVIRLDALPKTATGKVQKAKLREAYADFYASNDRGSADAESRR